MTMLNIYDTFHHMHITGLMLFKPAMLFHKIYSLPWYQRTLHEWIDNLHYREGDAILEAGCATGQLVQHLTGLGLSATGVDNSADMLEVARATTTKNSHFELASALDLPFRNNQFDHVIAASLLNIISRPEVALAEMLRVCKTGGNISVLVPLAGMPDEAVLNLSKELNISGFSLAILTTWHRRAPKMERSELREYFIAAGLSQLQEQTYLGSLVITMTATK